MSVFKILTDEIEQIDHLSTPNWLTNTPSVKCELSWSTCIHVQCNQKRFKNISMREQRTLKNNKPLIFGQNVGDKLELKIQ
jgi:hypothetical protein